MLEKNMSKPIDQNHASNHEALFNAEWQKSQDNFLVKGWQAGREAGELLAPMPGFQESFKAGDPDNILNVLKCSDGRVNDSLEIIGDEKLGLAGEGILFDKAELVKFIHENEGKIKTVTSHEHCGAAALKFSQMQQSGEIFPAGVTTSDELGIYFAKQLAQMMGVEYRHIGEAEFSSPIHNERLLVIDGTAKFNANKVPDFPPRYMSAALGLGANLDYVAQEAAVLAGISLGDHGFNQRFTAENPFYLMIISQNQEQLQAVSASLDDLVKKSAGRIRVIGLVAPEQE